MIEHAIGTACKTHKGTIGIKTTLSPGNHFKNSRVQKQIYSNGNL